MKLHAVDLGFTAGISVVLPLDTINPDLSEPSPDLRSNANSIDICQPGEILDGFRIALASQAGELKVIKAIAGTGWQIICEYDLKENGAIWHLFAGDINHDGDPEIIVGGMQGSVLVFNLKGELLWQIHCRSAISSLNAWEENQTWFLLVTSLDRTIRLYDAKGTMLWAQMMAGGINGVAIPQSSNSEIIAAGQDGTVRVFDAKTGGLKWFADLKTGARFVGHSDHGVVFGDDSKRIGILDLQTHEIRTQRQFACYPWNFRQIPGNSGQFAVSTYSFRFLGAENDEGIPLVGIYNTSTLEPLWEYSGPNVQDFRVFSYDSKTKKGQFLIVGTTSGEVLLLDASNGHELFDGHCQLPDLINSISFSSIYFANEKTSKTGLRGMIWVGCDDQKFYWGMYE
jgi:WD40 repeat protein